MQRVRDRRIGLLLAAVATTLAARTNIAYWNTVKTLTTGTQVPITAGSRAIRGEIERITDDVHVVISGNGQAMFGRAQVLERSSL